MTQLALVTGANRGIGLEVTRQLAQKGFTVILGSRTLEKGEAAVAQLGLNNVIPKALDVTNVESINAVRNWIESEFGVLDVLVNNAGINYDSSQQALTIDMQSVRDTMETNAFGAWQMAIAFASLLRKSQHPRLVNVSSGAGALSDFYGGAPAYSVSKTAMNAITIMLANEFKRDGVLVNAVCPGWVATDMGGAGGRPVEAGAASVVWAVDIPDDGPTGGFFRDGKRIDW